jgi:hypothetical protein
MSLNPIGAKALVGIRAAAVEATTQEVSGPQISFQHKRALLDEMGLRVHKYRQDLAKATTP